MKRWICDKEDHLHALLGRKDMLLWCDGCPEDSDFDNCREKKRQDVTVLLQDMMTEKCKLMTLVEELRKMHSENDDYTEPQ